MFTRVSIQLTSISISYREIHTWINETATKIVSQFGFGQLFDIHGQSHAIEIHDIGMGLSIEYVFRNHSPLLLVVTLL